jgi:putative ABC transport system permease protein
MTGTGLSLLGVLYPAIVASRMLPIDAMRVEQ